MTQPSHPYRLSRRHYSLGKNRHYQYVYRKGKSFPSRHMVLIYLPARDIRQYGRVNRTLLTVLSVGLLMAFAATAVMLLWPRSVYELFTPDAGLLAVASVLTVPAIANFFGSATRSAAFSLINGSGRPKLNLAVAIIDGVCARIGLAYLMGFALKMDCFGFWMGDALAGFMPFMIGFAFYLSERWMEKRT